MRLTVRHIKNALDHLGRLRPTRLKLNAKRNFSLREAVLLMAPRLMKMKEMGFTFKELSAALAEREIVIKAPTLNRYLSEYHAEQQNSIAAEAAARKPPKIKSVPPDGTRYVPAYAVQVSTTNRAETAATFKQPTKSTRYDKRGKVGAL